MHSLLIQKLDKSCSIASGGKLRRIVNNPIHYLLAIGHRTFIYPISQKSFNRSATLFWGDQINVGLPSGIDMYILGAKADDSEIRLTKYLIKNLKIGDSFIDVGAHFGYYSKLAAYLVGSQGKVVSCEPARLAFELLKKNTEVNSNIEIHNVLIGSQSEEITFYEFPTKYAEYNSIDIDQYKNADWFDESLVKESKLRSVAIDNLIRGSEIDFIKIDVEGAEHQVLLGAQQLIRSYYPTISLEYVHADRSNEAHKSAVNYLKDLGYQSNRILDSGELETVEDLDHLLEERRLESDNFIFIH